MTIGPFDQISAKQPHPRAYYEMRYDNASSIYRQSEKYVPIGGGLPRVLVALAHLVVDVARSIFHGVLSLNEAWDREKVMNSNEKYHATYAEANAHFVIEDLSQIAYGIFISLPIIGRIYTIKTDLACQCCGDYRRISD